MEQLSMDTDDGRRLGSEDSAGVTREWVHHVITLLDAAVNGLPDRERLARGAIVRASSLLRRQIDLDVPQLPDDGGRLLAWQVRQVRDYIDLHIADPVMVSDLSALIQRSEAHFSRCFRNTFGEAPHAFVVRRRLELATQCMLETAMTLSEIALRCGFADQAHLSKRFREATGQTPAAWRRARQIPWRE
jgi:AraC family transcriptional regulator